MFASSYHQPQQCWQSLQGEGLGMLRDEEYSFDRPRSALFEGWDG